MVVSSYFLLFVIVGHVIHFWVIYILYMNVMFVINNYLLMFKIIQVKKSAEMSSIHFEVYAKIVFYTS